MGAQGAASVSAAAASDTVPASSWIGRLVQRLAVWAYLGHLG